MAGIITVECFIITTQKAYLKKKTCIIGMINTHFTTERVLEGKSEVIGTNATWGHFDLKFCDHLYKTETMEV